MAYLSKLLDDCGHCRGPEHCPLAAGADGAAEAPAGRGRSLVLAAGAVFVVPAVATLAAASVVGAYCAGPSAASLGRWQTVGALAGLVFGVGVAKLLVHWLLRSIKTPVREHPCGHP